MVLSALAHAGNDDSAAALAAFSQSVEQLTQGEAGKRLALRLREPGEVEGGALDHAVDVLFETSPQIKRALLGACAVCIGADHEVTVAEAELFRAVAGGLGCPIPPVLAGQTLA